MFRVCQFFIDSAVSSLGSFRAVAEDQAVTHMSVGVGRMPAITL